MSYIKKIKLIGIILAVIAVFALLIYFHIFWWTMLGLLVLIVVLLHFSVSIHLKASRAEGIDIKAKYLFLTLYPRKKKAKPVPEAEPFTEMNEFEPGDDADDSLSDDVPAAAEHDIGELISQAEKVDSEEEKEPFKPEPPKDNKKPEENIPAEPPKEKGEGKLGGLKARFNKIKPYIPLGWKAVKKFCKAIRFEGVDITVDVGRFDAHEAAIYYGMVQAAVFDLLSKIAAIFTLLLKRADVRCCFGENKIDGQAELTVRVRPSTLIAIAFCTAVNFLRIYLRERRKRKKAAKAEAAAQAAS